MIKLNLNELDVTTYAIESSGGGLEPVDNTTTDTSAELTATDPRACPVTQGWNCYTTTVTQAAGCESGAGGNC